MPAVDNTPSITINTPTDMTYLLNQAVLADHTCTDEASGSGVASCPGPVANGSQIDTTSVGIKAFTVAATHRAGNSANRSASYTVTYNICVPYDRGKSHKLGSTVPIKLQLCDANGANVSASNLIKLDNSASGDLIDTSNANPYNDFHLDVALDDSGGYIYNLSTRSLSTHTWRLEFTASGDPESLIACNST